MIRKEETVLQLTVCDRQNFNYTDKSKIRRFDIIFRKRADFKIFKIFSDIPAILFSRGFLNEIKDLFCEHNVKLKILFKGYF